MGTISFLVLLITLSKFLIQAHSTTYWQDIVALKEFKNSVDPTSISPSTCLASWHFSVDPCDQTSSAEKFTCGLSCSFVSGSTRITEIALDPDANYSGSLSSLSFNFPYLQNLDLSYNSFSGPIPGLVSNMTRLKKLALSHNSFSGSIPASIGSLSFLEELYLDNNHLEGTIPNTLNGLKNLKRLEIQSNNITGDSPELTRLESLYYLDASENSISGDLPTSFPPNLMELAMRNNRIQGNIPSYIYNNMIYLQVLDLSNNSLTGSVPSGIFTHPSLQQVSLGYNKFGSIQDPGYTTLSTELIAIDFSSNDIHGILPAFIGLMPKLSSVSFENNKITGLIPIQYAIKAVVPGQGLARFERLLLGGNYLFGPIPGPFMNFKNWDSVRVSLGDNCLYRCPVNFFFCQGKLQKSLLECKSFVPVIP